MLVPLERGSQITHNAYVSTDVHWYLPPPMTLFWRPPLHMIIAAHTICFWWVVGWEAVKQPYALWSLILLV